MKRKDDRTVAQHLTHRILVIGTDKFMSGWGGARGGTSVAAWACTSEDSGPVERWVRNRKDMTRVCVVLEGKRGYRPPPGTAHLHIYVVDEDHPARKG